MKCCRLAVGWGGGCSELSDSVIRYCGASNNNTNNAIVFGHSGIEWPSVDAPAARPWAILSRNALRNVVIGILLSLARAIYWLD